jgi:parallel beta-helix repeat protein
MAVFLFNVLREGFSCPNLLRWLSLTAFGMLLVDLLCANARAETFFYVDSAWTGAQSGAASAPWTSLNGSAWDFINTALQSGGVTIFFSAKRADASGDGLYDSNGDGAQDIVDLTRRTANTPFTLTFDGSSYYNSNETAAAWSKNPGPSMCVVQAFEAQNSAHAKYSNLRIHGFRIVRNTGGKLVSISGDNVIVENCDMSHTPTATDGPGLYLVPTADGAHEGTPYYSMPCTNIVIRNNVVHDTFGEAMYLGGGGANPGQAGAGYPSHSHVLIESNTIYRASIYGGQGDGIDVKGGIDFLTIRANEIYSLSSFNSAYDVRGIVMQGQYQPRAGEQRIVEKNRIHDCSGLQDAAVSINNNWGNPQGLMLRNNLIYNIKANRGTPGGIKVYGSQDVVGIYNNTVYNCAGFGIDVQNGAQAAVVNNLAIYNNVGSAQSQGGQATTLLSDANAFSLPWVFPSEGPHSIGLSKADIANTLVNPTLADFHLKAGAPVLGKATVLSGFADDIAGNVRGSVWDIGAYQVSSGGAKTPLVAVMPPVQDFGSAAVGSTVTRTFTVQNRGSQLLTGIVSVEAPFRIVSGGAYSLGAGQSQIVTVQFNPTSVGTNSQTVIFTGGGGASSKVSGIGFSFSGGFRSPADQIHAHFELADNTISDETSTSGLASQTMHPLSPQ